ncbi:elongation factor G [Dehalococcoidia bacterium]|nr:elongation factor G [Dehalococcoidia bacterium]
MDKYNSDQIRNCVIVSHSGTGKTILAESMLYTAGLITRIGAVEDGNTVSDFEEEEIKRSNSVQASLMAFDWRGTKINLIDTPGFADFRGEVVSALTAADSVVLVVAAPSGVEVGTQQMWQMASSQGIPRMIFVSKMDRENASFSRVMSSLADSFGRECVPVQLPVGSEADFTAVINLLDPSSDVPTGLGDEVEDARERLIEAAAESDDELAEKYLEGEEITQEELIRGLRAGLRSGDFVPVLFGASQMSIGIAEILDGIVDLLPAPSESEDAGEPDGPLSAYVFKTTADPYVGKLSYFRVNTGTFSSDSQIWNVSADESERVGQTYVTRGKEQEPVASLVAGDIGAVPKLDSALTGHTLGDKGVDPIEVSINLPNPIYTRAVYPKSKADVDKMSTSLARITEEDPSLDLKREPDTLEMLLSGLGDTHLEVSVEKMKRKFGVEIDLETPRIPYRETITTNAAAEFKHKKQSGGHGQYGHVVIQLEPLRKGKGFEFESKVVGGSVPREYIPSVEKGIRESLGNGTIGGFPVTDLKAILVDGSFHAVDSSGVSFEIAASQAFSTGMEKAGAVLLEPIMNINVIVPDDYTGDIIGDLNSRRGRIQGMAPSSEGFTSIEVEVPYQEILDYATIVRSVTQGLGTFDTEFARYEETPQHMVESAVSANNELIERQNSRA